MTKTNYWTTTKLGLSIMLVIILVFITACGNNNNSNNDKATDTPATTESSTDDKVSSDATGPGTGGKAVGFIFVGAKDDYGYNQAGYIGSEAVEKEFPDYKILRSENVPETAEAERVMEEMIRNGAKIIFPTSYGHLDPALNVAKRHPDVLFFHQGGLKTADNLGTYFGTIWEPVYLAGVAAGKMSKSGKLGYIVSIPIPQVLLNVNAFELGAKSVNPDATTTVVFTGSWCDPGQQANAANSMIDQGIDVLSQHQDCTKTVIETAERRGIMSVGYHADASELAPKGWIVGSIWNWPALFVDMVKVASEGKFAESKYAGQYRGTMAEDIVQLTGFGAEVPEDVKKLIEEKKAEMAAGTLHPFKGPIKDQSGTVKVEDGISPDVTALESIDYLVEGVIGSIPK